MLEASARILMQGADVVFGWLLHLPRDLALVCVAFGTAFILVCLRKWSTDQSRLRCLAQDKRRQTELLRAARRQGDSLAGDRHKRSLAQIGVWQLMAEGKPLLLSLIPIAILATWCSYRLAYVPPRDGESLQLELHAPPAVQGEIAFLVPQEGLASAAWVQEFGANFAQQSSDRPNCIAIWNIVGKTRRQPYELQFRAQNRTFTQRIYIGGTAYEEPVTTHSPDGSWRTEARLKEAKLLGIVPGFDGSRMSWVKSIPVLGHIVLPPWLVAYLLIAIPATYLIKWLLDIY